MRIAIVFLFASALGFAQQDRETYRSAYQTWRTSEPNLESEAAGSAATLGARADQAGTAAAKYFTEKKNYADARAAATRQVAKSVDAFNLKQENEEQLRNISSFLNTQGSSVTASITAFGDDPDKGIQQLRQTMEREQSAINALTEAFTATRDGADKALDATNKAEDARAKFADALNALAASYEKAADATKTQGTSWIGYYRTLSDISKGVAPTPIPQLTTVPAASPALSATAVSAATAPAANLVPLSRYVGSWAFMRPGSIFLGMEPDSAELEVHEEKGQISGTLFVKFRLPTGFQVDPLVRFDFSGPIQSTRTQTFPLVTNDNAKGSVSLIPGPAFNLLEVNFKADPAAGKIRQGNFILLKK